MYTAIINICCIKKYILNNEARPKFTGSDKKKMRVGSSFELVGDRRLFTCSESVSMSIWNVFN